MRAGERRSSCFDASVRTARGPNSRYTFGQGPVILPTCGRDHSLCCSRALEWRSIDPARFDKALEKGAEYLKAAGDKARGKFENLLRGLLSPCSTSPGAPRSFRTRRRS